MQYTDRLNMEQPLSNKIAIKIYNFTLKFMSKL